MKESLKLTGSRCKVEVQTTSNVLSIEFLNNNEDCEFGFVINDSDHMTDLLSIISELKDYLVDTKKKQDLFHETVIMNDSFIITYHMKEDTFPYINLSITKIIKSTEGKHIKKHKIISNLRITNKELKCFYKMIKKVCTEIHILEEIRNVS